MLSCPISPRRAVWLAAFICAAAAASAADSAQTPQRVSRGAEVELADYLVPGKTVVFDFYSDYCPPCRAYSAPLAALDRLRDDVVVVTVDINRVGVTRIDWRSPVAQQFRLRSVPHFKIYGPDGLLLAEDNPQTRLAPARQFVHDLIAETLAEKRRVAAVDP